MCGLCGVAGTITNDDVKVFKDLLVVSAIRGIDSTGIAVIPYGHVEPEIIKQTGNSFELLDRIAVMKALQPGNAALMGHTRWRTRGDVNKQNAQPFEFPGLIGTHNGTLDNMTKARLEGRAENWGTDSAALYSSINTNGLELTLPQLEKLDAMALVWYDKDTRKLNMFRNDWRPLHYAFSKDHKTLYWASEAGMLYLVLNHNKVDFKKTYKLEPHQLLTLDIPEKNGELLGKPHIKPIRFDYFKYPVVARQRGEASERWGGWVKIGEKWVKQNPAEDSARIFLQQVKDDMASQSDLPFAGAIGTPNVVSAATSGTVVPFTNSSTRNAEVRMTIEKWLPDTLQNRSPEAGGPFYKTARGQVLDEAAFDEKMNEGCAINGEVPTFGEPVKFLKDDSFICAGCLADAKEGKMDDLSLEAVLTMI